MSDESRDQPQAHLPSDHAAELHPSAASLGTGYEVRDTRISGILLFIIGLFIVLTLTQFAMWGLLKGIAGGKPETADPLEVHAVALDQRHALDAAEASALEGYGRIADPAKTTEGARIPITRAIDLLSERGIPPVPGRTRSEVEVNSHAGTVAPTPDRTPARKGAEK